MKTTLPAMTCLFFAALLSSTAACHQEGTTPLRHRTLSSGAGSPPVEESVADFDRGDRLSTSLDRPSILAFERLAPCRSSFIAYPFPFLPDERSDQSVSIGTVTEGFLVNAAELFLPAPHIRVCQRQLFRNLRFTTDEMLSLLFDAARAVEEQFAGSTLWLGNLSRRGGGDIPYSVSHNSGRDADLAYYFCDEQGVALDPPDLLTVGPDLRASDLDRVYLFDVPRNWALVRALLSHPQVQVQFLFTANHLKRALLAHAALQGEPPQLLERASTVMLQPGRTNPHDDHLHIRIYCSQEDIGGGCVNIGRVHPWVETYPQARSRRIAQVHRFLDHDDPAVRAAAVARLTLLDSRDDLGRITRLLRDRSSLVRIEVLRAIQEMGGQADVDPVIERFHQEVDPAVLIAALSTLGKLRGQRAEEFLIELLSRPERVVLPEGEVDLRALAVDALAERRSSGAVEALIGLLASDDPYLRARVIWALERITNRRLGHDWEDYRQEGQVRRDGLQQWRDWFLVDGGQPPDRWLAEGFGRQGYPVSGPEGTRLGFLVKAIDAPLPFLGYNAQRLLMDLTRTDSPSLMWSRGDASWYWQRLTSALP
ncbi:MAG: penicillin-insensitive murein endopeptidase [Bradymonadales bacterium]|nr:penicillin-insensitive murein endopeptidase [Bradymonadales bacterium]